MRVEGFSRECPIYENIHALRDTQTHTRTMQMVQRIFFLLFNEMKCDRFFKMLQKRKTKGDYYTITKSMLWIQACVTMVTGSIIDSNTLMCNTEPVSWCN